MHTARLADFLAFPVHSVPPETPVQDVLARMRALHIGAMVVTDPQQRPLGIFSEHDAVMLDSRQQGFDSIPVSEAMSHTLITARPEDEIPSALRAMAEHKLQHLVVVDETGALAGTVSAREIIGHAELPGLIGKGMDPARQRTRRYPGGRARAWLYALLAILLVIATEQVVENYAGKSALAQERVSVLDSLSTLSARLEGVVNANLLLVHGLTAVISAKPDIDQEEFSHIARGLVDDRHALRNLAGAPGMVVSLMYPLTGNEAAIGLNYQTHPLQRAMALRVMQTGKPWVAGPLSLVQGGIGIIVREPVFVPAAHKDEKPRFWGLLSAVIAVDALYRQAELDRYSRQLRLAIRGVDGTGAGGAVFYGDAKVFSSQPLTRAVVLPGGTWQMAALPLEGWGRNNHVAWLIRGFGFLAALVAGILAYFLARGGQALADSEARLRTLLNTIPDLIWLKDVNGVYLSCNSRFEQLYGAKEAEILGKTDQDFVAADLAESIRENDRAAIEKGGPSIDEERLIYASDGHEELSEIVKTPVFDKRGALLGVLGIARDITQRKQSEEHIKNLNRVYAVLSGINEAIVRKREPIALFNEACRIAVELGGFRMAWLGLADTDSGEARPLAQAGVAEGHQAWMHLSLSGEEAAPYASGPVLKEGRHVIRNDLVNDPRTAPWRELILAGEIRASAAFPIWVNGQVRGAFNLFADRAGFFNENELRLLDELARNIGFALEFNAAEIKLLQQRDILDRTGRLAQVGGWDFDVSTRRASWTDETARIYDLDPNLKIDLAQGLSYFQRESRVRIEHAMQEAVTKGQAFDLELEFTSAMGVDKWARTIGLPIREAGRVVRVEGAIQDVSIRKRAEIQAKRGELLLDSVFQALPDLFFLMGADGTIVDYRARQSEDLYAPPERFLGKRMQEILPAELSELFQQKLLEVERRGGLVTYEYDLSMSAGVQRFEIRLNRLPDSAQLIAVIRNVTRQYQDRQALAGSEARYRQLFEQNPAPMLVYEKGSLLLLAVNEAFTNHYGYNQDDVRALRLTDLYPVEERQLIVELATKITGLVYVGEWHHLKKDGSRINIESRSHDLPFEGRDARIAVITDITERKLAEQALRESETRYRSLLEMAPFPAVLTRVSDGVLLYGNHRAEVQFGIKREAGIGQAADNFYEEPSERTRFIEAMESMKHVEDLEVRMRRQDGSAFWALVSASIVEFDNEPAIFAAINDITSRKNTDAALREQEEFFRLIAENMGDMVAVLDRDGRRLYNSPSYRALLGNPEGLKGTDSFAEIHPQDLERVRNIFLETVRTGHGHRINFRFVLHDGSVRDIESQGGVIRAENGEVERVVVVSRDITERKRLEDEIRQLNAELEQRVLQRTAELAAVNRELETFTYSVSHDLKAPLRGIDGYSRLLLEDHSSRLDEEGRLFVRNVRRGVDQMSELIEDLLAYSRMERRNPQAVAVQLAPLVQGLLAERQEEIAALGVQVKVELDHIVASADQDGLTIILRNLIDNAIKFSSSSQPPRVFISASRTEKSVILAVQDNGIGFDMQFHERIFDIFQRLQRAEDYPGTGVGLAIVRKAVQRMGGRIWAQSAPGQGATFHLELPR